MPLPLKDECWIEVGASHASYKYDESKQASINNEPHDGTKRRPIHMSMNMNNMMIRRSLVGLRIGLGTGRTSSGWGAAGVST